MNEMLPWLLRISELCALLYGILIFLYTLGWFRLKNKTRDSSFTKISVTVLVAARNEENTIENLLNDLAKQDYPINLLEIIIVDDHSEDTTQSKIQSFLDTHTDLNIKLLKAKNTSKKAALAQAFSYAKGQFILVTDADCRPNSGWVTSMTGFYDEQRTKMVLGPVLLDPTPRFFDQIQSLEFMSLIGSTAGACGIGLPSMANGANLGFEREAASALGKEAFNTMFASGDDVFLLHAMKKKFGNQSIAFVLDEKAIVKTSTSPNITTFLQQRMRWVSKSKGYSDFGIILPAIIVFLFNLAVMALFVATVFYSYFLPITTLFIILKFMIDYPLLSETTRFMQKRRLLIWALPLEIFYPFYIVIIAIAGNISGIYWKGRKI